MSMNCDEVRQMLAPTGEAPPLSEEGAEAAAAHLDQCEECDRLLGRQLSGALGTIPTEGAPSLGEVRRLQRSDRNRFQILRVTAAAAALLAILATGWSLTRAGRPSPQGHVADGSALPSPVDEPAPEPPKFSGLSEPDQRLIQSEGVISLYLQFCLSCLNQPTEEDKREFLIRALLILREARSTLRTRFERRDTVPARSETATLEGLSSALQALRSSPLPSVKLLPSKITGFALLPDGQWRVDHLLGSTPFRLTLPMQPLFLNFSYLKLSLGADEALMGRIEDVLWSGVYVDLPRHLVEKDPTIPERALRDVLPLLSPRQKKIYRKLTGLP
jgi:hypothetical protein